MRFGNFSLTGLFITPNEGREREREREVTKATPDTNHSHQMINQSINQIFISPISPGSARISGVTVKSVNSSSEIDEAVL